ncbi:UDP-N-acetylmuramoyl-L-alanine--D-glutamate ligase [Candidatus Uhrbacteria bacterium]|nr:UDP-N-acetylmuramoyl-L-alanine--D-glutamate ligase [Candidatus Uhrbacteria bacterium]
MEDLRGKRVTVMGLGVNGGGLGVARFLARAGAHVLVTDLKARKELATSVRALRGVRNTTYVLGRHRDRDFTDTDLVIQGPGVPRESKYLALARAYGVPIATDVGIFLDACPSRHIIVVTGTKGKTTTTLLIAAMLRAERREVVVAGNLGISVLDALAKITPETWVVLELSSWQLEGVADRGFAPSVAVLTNILPDHLDRYASFTEYADVKRSLVAHQRPDQIAVLNADDSRVRGAARATRARVLSASARRRIAAGCTIEDGWVVFRDGERAERIMPIAAIPIPGAHNQMNVLLAATAARASGVLPRAIRSAVEHFHGVPHRLELVRTRRGVRYYNDTTATMPDATIAALDAIRAPTVLICGGKDKGLAYDALSRTIVKTKRVRHVVLLAHSAYSASVAIKKLAARHGWANRIVPAADMRDAVRAAAKLARSGDAVLLSPGAASFGMFVNEFDRGEQFRAAVHTL